MLIELTTATPFVNYIGSFFSESQTHLGSSIVLLVFSFLIFSMFGIYIPLYAISYFDRKMAADIQMRLGPNRVGFLGVLQIFTDGLKLFFKENAKNPGSNSFLIEWGAIFGLIALLFSQMIIPVAERWYWGSFEISLLLIIFCLVLNKFFLFLAAYSIEKDIALLSSFRILAMVANYFVPLLLAITVPILISGTMDIQKLVNSQGGSPFRWLVFHDFGTLISGFVFFVSILIWQARVPFDYERSESELKGGFSSNYSGINLRLFFLQQQLSIFVSSCLFVACYLGGWKTPFYIDSFGRAAELFQYIIFLLKVFLVIFISFWIRWSLPSLRIDQITKLTWKILVPLGLLGLVVSCVWMVLFKTKGIIDFL